jgi:hypothetical protein
MEQGKKGIMGKTFLNRILSLPQHSTIPIFDVFGCGYAAVWPL